MATTLTDAATTARDATFRDRATAAAVRVAIGVIAETRSDVGNVAVRRRRSEFAHSVIHAPGLYADHFAWPLAVYEFGAASTDAELIAAIRARWDDLAGVTEEVRTGQ